MKRFFWTRIVVAISIGMVLIPAWAESFAQAGRLSLIQGSVSFNPGTVDEWVPAELNYPLSEGDSLWTDSGARAEIQIPGASLRLNATTEFSFLTFTEDTVQLRLSQGALYVSLGRLDQNDYFEISTPETSVTLLRAGTYRIEVSNSGRTSITVRSGRAEMTAGTNVYIAESGQTRTVSSTDYVSFYYEHAGTAGRDDWDNWNQNRDERENQYASNSNISRDIMGYADLGEHGTWTVEAGYGSAWTPRNVPNDWAPYRNGHWSWVEPWGWSWVDAADWGFAPFHYGRWAFANNRWFWLPGAVHVRPVYAPALVVFVGGNNWNSSAGVGIGWFPLGPREVYVPPYHVNTTYVQRINVAHVTNINVQVINNINVEKVVYVNRAAPRGVTFVNQDTFVNSRQTGRATLAVTPTDTSRAPVMGMRAQVVPQRASIAVAPSGNRAAIPPAESQSRRVLSRTEAPARPVPFAERQQALRENPGRPVAPQALSTLQRAQRPSPAQVTVINPAPAAAGRQEPTREAPGRVAPGRATPSREAPARDAPSRETPTREAPTREAPGRVVPGRVAPSSTTTTISASRAPSTQVQPRQPLTPPPSRTAPGRDAPSRGESGRDAPVRGESGRDAPSRSGPVTATTVGRTRQPPVTPPGRTAPANPSSTTTTLEQDERQAPDNTPDTPRPRR